MPNHFPVLLPLFFPGTFITSGSCLFSSHTYHGYLVAFSAGSIWESAVGGHLSLLLLVCYLGPHPVGLLAPSFRLVASDSAHQCPQTLCIAQGPLVQEEDLTVCSTPKGSWVLCPPPAPFPGTTSIYHRPPMLLESRVFAQLSPPPERRHCWTRLTFRAASFRPPPPLLWAFQVVRRIGSCPTPVKIEGRAWGCNSIGK